MLEPHSPHLNLQKAETACRVLQHWKSREFFEPNLREKLQFEDGILDDFFNIISALNQVKNTCFGLKLDKSYKEQIQLYKAAYQLLGIKISPKVHALVTHMPQFFDSMQKNYHEKGFGFWCEQASENCPL